MTSVLASALTSALHELAVKRPLQSADSTVIRIADEEGSALIAAAVPTIPLENFVHYAILHAKCSAETFIIGLCYLCRISRRGKLQITSHSVHRAFLASTVLAAKYRDDRGMKMCDYAAMGNVTLQEMLNAELALLRLLNYDAGCTRDDYLGVLRWLAQPSRGASEYWLKWMPLGETVMTAEQKEKVRAQQQHIQRLNLSCSPPSSANVSHNCSPLANQFQHPPPPSPNVHQAAPQLPPTPPPMGVSHMRRFSDSFGLSRSPMHAGMSSSMEKLPDFFLNREGTLSGTASLNSSVSQQAVHPGPYQQGMLPPRPFQPPPPPSYDDGPIVVVSSRGSSPKRPAYPMFD